MTLPLHRSYLLTETRFRVDAEGTCIDQRQETIDAISYHVALNMPHAPLKITFNTNEPPYAHYDLRIPLDLLKGPFNC